MMAEDSDEPPQEIIESTARGAPNPFAHSAHITVSVPETVDVKLVDATVLGDYEVWILLTSILSSAVTGFAVALVQAPPGQKGIYVTITAVFLLITLICAVMAFAKRSRLTAKAKRVRFRVGEPVSDD